MERVKVKDKFFIKYISAEQIDDAVEKLAQKISLDYKDKQPPLFIVIMTGGYIFMADLSRKMTIDSPVSSITVTSYHKDKSTNKISVVNGLSIDITDRDIILVDEIADSAQTLFEIKKLLFEKGAKSVKCAVLIDKPHCHIIETTVDYAAIVMEDNNFIVGYGLDYDGFGRGYKDIYIAE